MLRIGWRYKNNGERVQLGDRVKISKRWAKEHGCDKGEVTGLMGFITVTLNNGRVVDFDARSITKE